MVEFEYVKTRRADVKPIKAAQVPIARFIIRWATRFNVTVFRVSKARLMNKFPGGYPVGVVTKKGARSGRIRRIALIYLGHGDSKLLVVSQGGTDKSPDWCHNILAQPDVQTMVDGAEQTYRARQVSGEEKARLWPHLLIMYPYFDQYQARTDRNIPVFSCEAPRRADPN